MKKVFCLLAFLAFLGLGYQFYQWQKSSCWDGRQQLNLVVQATSVVIISFQPDRAAVVVLLIPNQTYLRAAYGYGPYRAEAIYDLGELENRGGQLLQASIQESLGLPLDGFLRLPSFEWAGEFDAGEFKRSLLEQLWPFKPAGQTPVGNLSQWDMMRLWWALHQTRSEKITLMSLEETTAFGMESLFTDSAMVKEGLAVATLNATNYSGLAAQAGRLVSNAGGRVVETAEWSPPQAECEIRASQESKDSYTVQKLKKIFACRLGGSDLAGHRADLVIILGEDYGDKLK